MERDELVAMLDRLDEHLTVIRAIQQTIGSSLDSGLLGALHAAGEAAQAPMSEAASKTAKPAELRKIAQCL